MLSVSISAHVRVVLGMYEEEPSVLHLGQPRLVGFMDLAGNARLDTRLHRPTQPAGVRLCSLLLELSRNSDETPCP